MNILLYPNLDKYQVSNVVDKIIDYFNDQTHKIFLKKEHAYLLNKTCILNSFQDVDIAISLGGDGTFLGMCRELLLNKCYVTNVTGINMGTLGFLTTIQTNNLTNRLFDIANKNYSITKRSILESDDNIAINDIAVTKGSMISRMLHFAVYIDDKHFMDYRADGIIIATATGSTGYNLSAGGSIVHPSLDAILITPICAHSIKIRPLIVRANTTIRIQLLDSQDALVTFDGQKSFPLKTNREIEIKNFNHKLNSIQFKDLTYFDVLKEKLL